MSRFPICLIAAVAENGVIGRDNDMPWKLTSDLQRFKALTMGKPIVMGRKTFQSIGRPLPGRHNIVVTRDATFDAEGIVVASSVEGALALAEADLTRRSEEGLPVEPEIMVIGGGEIYAQAMAVADRLYITEVAAAPVGDARFPAIAPEEWAEISRVAVDRDPRDSASTAMITYHRR